MPPSRGRASQACASCRKQKTRCYETGVSGAACIRCDRLHQQCSFTRIPSSAPAEDRTTDNSSTDARLERLEHTVNELLRRLGEDSTISPADYRTSRYHANQDSQTEPLAGTVAPYESVNPPTAPVMVLRDLATDMGISSPDSKANEHILEGLVDPELELTLIKIFQEHYGRWVLFDSRSPPTQLLSQIRKSPLLLSACCLIAVRHTTQPLAARLAPKLYERAQSLISTALLVSPQSLDLFQGVIVLSMWSTTVGQVPMSIDSWLLSGFALQHCHSNPQFEPILNLTPSTSLPHSSLDIGYLWNHLCLVHLHYCVGTSRKCMIGASHIEKCCAIVRSDHATNYELRMVAEIKLYWSLYENYSPGAKDILKALAALQAWKQEWSFVLEQPRSQFLIMGYHFTHLLLYDQSLKSRTVRARESVIPEMIRHATSIINLAIDTTDDRTRHLSDHIYHMITFAAVIICRLLHKFEEQLKVSHDVSSLDSLIMKLVAWMQSVGLPCHAAHTLGNVIAATHRKLRSRSSTETVIEQYDPQSVIDYAAFFPDFMGLETTPNGSWDFRASWGPFDQDLSDPSITS